MYLKSVTEDLPDNDAERPYIRLDRVLVMEDGLQGHPPDGNGVVLLAPVVILGMVIE